MEFSGEGFAFGLANIGDSEEVLELYRSVSSADGCIWCEYYPTQSEISQDVAQDGLFVLRDNGGAIIAAVSSIVDEELDELGVFDKCYKKPCALSRLAVCSTYNGRGVGRYMVRRAMDIMRDRGYDLMCLFVNPKSPAAVNNYTRCGFKKCGECELYGCKWHCMEIPLKGEINGWQ